MAKLNIDPTLALQQGIKQQMDDIVKAATEAALLLEDSEMRNNQIRNVLNVAEESDSVEVVTNFIRYQIGRSSTDEYWQHNGFGLRVIEDITKGPVQQSITKVMKNMTERLGQEADTPELRQQAHLALLRHYLGYLSRAFIFGSLAKEKITPPEGQAPKSGWDYLKPVVKKSSAKGEK